QKIAVRADPATENDECHVRDGCEWRDVEGDPTGFLLHNLPCQGITGARRSEDRAGIERCLEERVAVRLLRETGRELRESPGARIDVLVDPRGEEVELSRGTVMPAVELAAQHEPGAKTRTHRQEGEVVHTLGGADPLLTEGREVDVVLDLDRTSQDGLDRGAERHTVEPRKTRESHEAVRAVEDARH